MKEKLALTVVSGSNEEECSTLATTPSPPKLKGMCKTRRYAANVLHTSSGSHGMSEERSEYSCDLITEKTILQCVYDEACQFHLSTYVLPITVCYRAF